MSARTVRECRDRHCPDLILIPGEYGYRCRHSGQTPRYTTTDCKMDKPHPVHTGELPASSKNCKGCYGLVWQDWYDFGTGYHRRRVCTWHDPPRIPGNIRCPVRFGPAPAVPEMKATHPEGGMIK